MHTVEAKTAAKSRAKKKQLGQRLGERCECSALFHKISALRATHQNYEKNAKCDNWH
jgi:hypothetical protein